MKVKEHAHTRRARVALDDAKKKLAIADTNLANAQAAKNEAQENVYRAEYEVRIQESIDLDRK